MEIQIDQCMHLKKQVRGFKIKVEKLARCFFVHFINPITIYCKGKPVRMGTNCCFICTPGETLHYVSETHSMLHNFVHFQVSDISDLTRLGVPLNKPFYTDLQEEITDTVEKMEWSRSAWNPDIIPPAHVLFERMLERIAEEQTSDSSSYGNPKKLTFEHLRTRIYISPGEWSVEKMAQFMHLTRTYFSKVYKDYFGVTPKSDLAEAAIMYAERTLLTTELPVAEIARRAGYSAHASHFISLFKKKYGLTPDQYRRQNGKKCGGVVL